MAQRSTITKVFVPNPSSGLLTGVVVPVAAVLAMYTVATRVMGQDWITELLKRLSPLYPAQKQVARTLNLPDPDPVWGQWPNMWNQAANFISGINPDPGFVFGDLNTQIVLKTVTNSSATIDVKVTNKSAKSGAFVIAFMMLHSDTAVYVAHPVTSVKANATETYTFNVSSLQPATFYRARSFAIDAELKNVLSEAVDATILTQGGSF